MFAQTCFVGFEDNAEFSNVKTFGIMLRDVGEIVSILTMPGIPRNKKKIVKKDSIENLWIDIGGEG